jgi:glycerophosphoryl diester phosphodiesterase
MPTLVIAHRGASGNAPENTIAAFELARIEGADMIELDVQPVRDGTLFVFHDDTTERWNGRPDVVRQLSAADMRQVRLGGEPVPTFDEVCRWARDTGMRLNVELKGTGFEADAARMMREYDLVEQVLVSSFYPTALVALRGVAPELSRGALMGIRSAHPRIRMREAWPFTALRRLGAVAWHPAWQLPLLPRLMPMVRKRGYQVNVWTVDEPSMMQRLIVAGVDGIITNYPARLRALVDRAAGDGSH